MQDEQQRLSPCVGYLLCVSRRLEYAIGRTGDARLVAPEYAIGGGSRKEINDGARRNRRSDSARDTTVIVMTAVRGMYVRAVGFSAVVVLPHRVFRRRQNVESTRP